MKELNRYLFRAVILIYLGLCLGFLGNTFLAVLKKPTVSGTSAIPTLAVDRLNAVMVRLEKREVLPEFTPIDITKFQFGKIEPFRP